MEKELYPHIPALEKELENTNMSQAKLSQLIGVSSSALSQYLKANYQGNIDNLNAKIKAYLQRKNERADHWIDLIVETEVMNNMLRTIGLVHAMRKIGIIYGPAGIGKTISIERYSEDNPGTLVVTATPDSKSVRGIVALLYHAIFGRFLKGAAMTGRMEIVDALRGTDKIIIVDEAHKLSNDAIQEIKTIFDATRVPFMLVGTDIIFDRLKDPRTNHVLEEVSSRIPIRRHFNIDPSKRDLERLCQAYGVTDKDILKRMAAKGRSGGLRLVSDQLKIARFIASGRQVTMQEILDAEAVSERKEEI